MRDNIRFLITAAPRGQYGSWLQLSLTEVMDMDLEMFQECLEHQQECNDAVDAWASSRGRG